MAQNPIVPTGTYLADPSARQWNNKTIYVYGSRDESLTGYCSRHYDVLSSKDMRFWSLHRNIFSSVTPNDQVPYSDNLLFAPDCIQKDGIYYLYYCLSGGVKDEGTAISDSPIGPFTDGQVIEGVSQIDPSVFIDDDGQAYMTWGQVECKIAKLKANMREIESGSICSGIITEKEHHFHEGSQLIKRNGIYYLIYAHIGRRGMPTCIGYSTSTSPFGPYKYGGVIIDNFGCDPQVWNNHGSIAQINNKWYVFYHRSTEASALMRKACVEPISFNPDGSIDEVEMTTQGSGNPLNPFEVTNAERACYLTGNIRVHCDKNGNEMLDGIKNGDTAAYKYYNFIQAPKFLTIILKPYSKGTIEVFANNLAHPLLCTFDISASNVNQPIKLTQKITCKLRGKSPLYFRFKGPEGELFTFESFIFE